MAKHNPDDAAIIIDVTGTCRKCRRHGMARLVGYYSGEILVRCNNCKTANQFDLDNEDYNNPSKWLPFRSDADDEDKSDTGSGRYKKGKR